jgi:hypothetical protein
LIKGDKKMFDEKEISQKRINEFLKQIFAIKRMLMGVKEDEFITMINSIIREFIGKMRLEREYDRFADNDTWVKLLNNSDTYDDYDVFDGDLSRQDFIRRVKYYIDGKDYM